MAPSYPNHGRIDGPIVIIGFGSIGRGTLPLIERHFTYDPHRVHVIEPSDEHRTFLEQRGVHFVHHPVTPRELPGAADAALSRRGAASASTCRSTPARSSSCGSAASSGCSTSTPWSSPGPGTTSTCRSTPADRTNYALREAVRAEKRAKPGRDRRRSPAAAPTRDGVVAAQGGAAAARRRPRAAGRAPADRAGWARLMRDLGVKGVHIAERDTQAGRDAKPIGSFVNTWSVEGFVAESFQPAELGWGSHETLVPAERAPARDGLQGGDLSRHAGAADQGPHLDAGGRAAVRLSRHPQRGDLDRRLLHRRRGRRAGVPADLPLCLPPLRPGGAVAARDARARARCRRS